MTEASPPHRAAFLLVLLAVAATATLAYDALRADWLRAAVAGLAASLALVAALAFERRIHKAPVFAAAAMGLQVLSLTLAFGGESIVIVVLNVLASVAGLLAIIDRLVELPADWARAHA